MHKNFLGHFFARFMPKGVFWLESFFTFNITLGYWLCIFFNHSYVLKDQLHGYGNYYSE
jgi:hypothetical protein